MTLAKPLLELLAIVQASPNPVDFTNCAHSTKAEARTLVGSGHLYGPISRATLTTDGAKALKDAKA